jgi:hypothetical protein
MGDTEKAELGWQQLSRLYLDINTRYGQLVESLTFVGAINHSEIKAAS